MLHRNQQTALIVRISLFFFTFSSRRVALAAMPFAVFLVSLLFFTFFLQIDACFYARQPLATVAALTIYIIVGCPGLLNIAMQTRASYDLLYFTYEGR